MNANREVALNLVRAQASLFPANQAKRPLVRFVTGSTRNEPGINYLWQRYGKDALPAINLTGCGLVVIDLDRGHGDGVDGVAEFEKLLDQWGELPECPTVRTPRGGVHLYFHQPASREPVKNSVSYIANGVDIRGYHGFTIAPGAVMADGQFYESIDGTPALAEALVAGTIPEIPGWIVELAVRPKRDAQAERGPSGGELSRTRALDDKSAWAAEGLRREAHALAATGEGRRNKALYDFVCTFAGHAANGWTTKDEVYAAAEWACALNGYLTGRAANDGPKQFVKTFNSGWRWGYANPTHGPRESVINPNFTAGLKPRAA